MYLEKHGKVHGFFLYHVKLIDTDAKQYLPHGAYPATAGGGGGGLGPCRATVPPHRVCRVTRGRRCVVSCEGDRHLCHLCRLCRPCHHDTEGGGGPSESVPQHVP